MNLHLRFLFKQEIQTRQVKSLTSIERISSKTPTHAYTVERIKS